MNGLVVRSVILFTAGVLACTGITEASAQPNSARSNGERVTHDVVRISALDQLPDSGAPDACGSDADHQEWEQDNAIAVAPDEPDALVSAWIQDWQDAITVGWSHDGGRTWSTVTPRTSRCTWYLTGSSTAAGTVETGYAFEDSGSSNDPWVAIGPPDATGRRTTYLTSITMQALPAFGISAALVNRSIDNGRTWSNPHVLEHATLALGAAVDQTHVVADPARPGVAFALWTRFDFVNKLGEVRISRTADGGRTWSAPTTLSQSTGGRLAFFGQAGVLPDGALLATYTEAPPASATFVIDGRAPTGDYRQFAVRSTDGGGTWSTPVEVGTTSQHEFEYGRLALGPDGTAYVAWLRQDTPERTLFLATSTDGGRAWSAPRRVGSPLAAGPERPLAGIAVAGNGRTGVTFYDHRNDVEGDRVTTTDLWLRTSRDGRTWSERHLAGPFDLGSVPNLELGNYQGAAGRPRGLALQATLGPPLAGATYVVPLADAAGQPNRMDLFYVADPAID